jgi:hypothetical protein
MSEIALLLLSEAALPKCPCPGPKRKSDAALLLISEAALLLISEATLLLISGSRINFSWSWKPHISTAL